MPIRTIETIAIVGEDRRLVLQLPIDVPVGRHRVIAVLDEAPESTGLAGASWRFPVVADAHWPADMPLTRAEMYDDHGR
jgi:hypothetical protein